MKGDSGFERNRGGSVGVLKLRKEMLQLREEMLQFREEMLQLRKEMYPSSLKIEQYRNITLLILSTRFGGWKELKEK